MKRVKHFDKFSKFHKFPEMDVSYKIPKFAVFIDPLSVIAFGVIT